MLSGDPSAHDHEARERAPASRSFLLESATWLGAALAGMITVFAGLALDAYRHNHGAGDESFLSLSNPGHLVAFIGLAVTAFSLLAGLTVVLGRTPRPLRLGLLVAAWTATASVAVGSLTYIGATGATIGHSHSDASPSAVAAHGAPTGAGSQATTTGQSPSGAPAAHDHGRHPTFTQFQTLPDNQLLAGSPAGTLTADQVSQLKAQLDQVRQAALKFPTVEAAEAAGYVNTTSDVPYMGMHYINYGYLRSGFDPSRPDGLLFSKIDAGPPRLVGVWFLVPPGVGGATQDSPPAGFAGDLDAWHAHTGLCLVGLRSASEGETADSCAAKGGRFTADLRWMMHVWVVPEATENPDGVFAYLNPDLFARQQAAASGQSSVSAAAAP